LGILDDQEKKIFEEHLPGCPVCQMDLAPLQGVADDLALSLDPKPLPIGHLQRFRDKAQNLASQETEPENAAVPEVTTAQPIRLPVSAAPSEFEQAQARKRRFSRLSSGWQVGYAAALVLFVAA